jgi:propionyl-CoA carboxylase beta chain
VQDVEANTENYTERFANPMVAAQRGFVDDIINPEDTRRIICEDLNLLESKKLENPKSKHNTMPL